MKKILFATDGSEYSDHAAQMAKEYLDAWPEATLTVLYVTAKENYAYDLIPDIVDKSEDQIAKRIKQDVLRRFGKRMDKVEFMHKTGHPGITICNTAKERCVDLIMVGSHGKGIIDRALIGSVANGVLHRAHVPVLVVKD